MDVNDAATRYASPEQLRYARALDRGMKLGLALLAGSFAAYVLRLIPAHVPLERLPQLWGLPLRDFLREAHMPTGWGWAHLMHHGDILNLAGVAILSGVTMLCYALVVPMLARTGQRAPMVMALAQIAVLLFAASGVFGGGH